MYRIEAKHDEELRWKPIDESKSLTEVIRWAKHYRNNVSIGWKIRLRKYLGRKGYETISG